MRTGACSWGESPNCLDNNDCHLPSAKHIQSSAHSALPLITCEAATCQRPSNNRQAASNTTNTSVAAQGPAGCTTSSVQHVRLASYSKKVVPICSGNCGSGRPAQLSRLSLRCWPGGLPRSGWRARGGACGPLPTSLLPTAGRQQVMRASEWLQTRERYPTI